MFKKTEDTEWSRFSRALSGQSKAAPEETPLKEQVAEPPAQAVREPAPVVQSPPAPVSAPRAAPQPAFTRPHPQGESEEVETVVGLHSSFDGTFRCESSMRIKGSAQGEIICGKSLAIEETAHVNAKITAASAVVAGRLEGSIVCEGRLEILATGQVSGELTSGVLIIQEGAFFEGHLKMKERRQEEEEEPIAEQPAYRRFAIPAGDSA